MTKFDNPPHPAIGSAVSDRVLLASGGRTLRLTDFAPGRLVLFTYGKDGTPTCDTAIADFNGLLPAFAAAGVTILGLSKDPVRAHDRHLAKTGHCLILASDQGGTLMEEMGAFGDKMFMGKQVRGVLRSTFLIEGTAIGAAHIAAVWSVDRVKGHAQAVLDHVLTTGGVV